MGAQERARENRGIGRPRVSAREAELSPEEDILRVAADLFATYGFEGTSVREIARRAGLRGPSLYYYFDGKEEILERILDYTLNVSSVYAVGIIAEEGSPASRLYRLLHQQIRRIVDSPYDLSCLVNSREVRKPRYLAWWRKMQQWNAAVEKLIREGIEAGELAPTDPSLALASIIGLVHSVLTRVHGQRDLAARDVAHYVARFAMRALLADPDRLDEVCRDAVEAAPSG